MNNILLRHFRRRSATIATLLGWLICPFPIQANPTGGTVTQGAASFNTAGSQFTINQTSANAFINWQSFNIGAGETTTFVQPSSSSVVWNQINDVNPSQILGSLNANGYVVLQNQSGFYVGGQAAITTHGLIMTTATTPALNLSSSGPWSFNAPPPTAKIINYGQINITGGGSAFLIASDVENANDGTYSGTISAPGGRIGLYAGEQVLVSMSPDGRGLSAQVTLPTGSVDNQGNLIADAGSIAAQAQFVNQGGLIQANSVQNINGVIELVASDSLNLGANSVISASGDSTATTPSPGGFVVLKSGNSYADTSTSTINVSGQAGGQGGIVEIFGTGPIQSSFDNYYALLVNPYDLTLSSGATDTSSSNPNLNANSLASYSQIDLQALDNIELGTLWTLVDPGAAAALNLTAGNNIVLDNASGIRAGNNWNVNVTAGAALASSPLPASGNDGVYLNGNSFIQTQNGNINVSAPNEVLVNNGAIRTLAGGSISVTTEYGNVNTGNNVNGYTFGLRAAPYYRVNAANLGGISTAAGGNVTIAAGGDVISYLPVQSDYANALFDGGTGAFGPQAGNVTITAGGNVYGHYVLANGIGTITAGGDIGDSIEGFALSLIAGSWGIHAPNGSIYVQDIRNPNGIFGESLANHNPAQYGGYHRFDYDPLASVLLDAGDSVEFIGGSDAPHSPASIGTGSTPIPFILPPIFQVITGSGDFVLDTSVILFPSPDQNLDLTIGRNFVGIPNGNPINLEMSDSAATRWVDDNSFGTSDHAAIPPELNNSTPVEISISGNMQDINLYTTKATEITVGGNVIDSGFVGENLHSSDVTSINVTGSIINSPYYSFASLNSGITSANPFQAGVWDSVFILAVNPAMVDSITGFDANNLPGGESLAVYLKQFNYLLFPSGSGTAFGSNPGFVYDSSSRQLAFRGVMAQKLSASQIAALEGGSITVLVADANGNPVIDANGHLETTTYNFSAASAIATLYSESLGASSNPTPGIGFQIGGPGQFNVHAASIDLGNTGGIGSDGFGIAGVKSDGFDYSSLSTLLGTPAEGGASVTVTVDGNLSMATSGIFSRDGGNVTVNAGGEIDLSQNNFDFKTTDCYGIYTSGHSDVSVTANGNINIGSARIATFNGGNVFVESYDGSVDAGNGVTEALNVHGFYTDPVTGRPAFVEFGDLANEVSLRIDPAPYGSGILAEIPTEKYQTGGISQPGNITVLTPHGNIVAARGGISQLALNGSIAGGPTLTLIAGIAGITDPLDPDAGNILLGEGGVIGGTVTVTATGKIKGYFVSRQNLNVTGQSFSGLGLAGQDANFSTKQAGDSIPIIIGIGKVNAEGLGPADIMGQNVSIDGGTAQSTLGTSVNASSASQSAANQSDNEAKQQLASDSTGSDDEKKKKKQPAIQRTKRVTVILPKA